MTTQKPATAETEDEAAPPEKTTEPAPEPDRGEDVGTTALALTPMRMLEIAVQQNADLEKLTKLMDLQERWEANQARKAYVKAMARFKAVPHAIVKDTHVNYPSRGGGEPTDYYHATLGQVCEVTGMGLGSHGLAHAWKTAQSEKGLITVTCIITHEEGHSEEVSLSAMPDTTGGKNAIQALGSAVTYLERYTLMAATGLAAVGQDDDGVATGDEDVPKDRPTRDQYKGTGPPPETDLGEPFTLLDEFGGELGVFASADDYLDAASKYIGKELSSAEGSASSFHDSNQETLDRVHETIGDSRSNSKVASFWRLLNGKKG